MPEERMALVELVQKAGGGDFLRAAPTESSTSATIRLCNAGRVTARAGSRRAAGAAGVGSGTSAAGLCRHCRP
jgi:hypothetical protein